MHRTQCQATRALTVFHAGSIAISCRVAFGAFQAQFRRSEFHTMGRKMTNITHHRDLALNPILSAQ
eukprot:2841922-Amphidinium_carterae.1